MAQLSFAPFGKIDGGLQHSIIEQFTPIRPDCVISITRDDMNNLWAIRVAGPVNVIAGAIPLGASAAQLLTRIQGLVDSTTVH